MFASLLIQLPVANPINSIHPNPQPRFFMKIGFIHDQKFLQVLVEKMDN